MHKGGNMQGLYMRFFACIIFSLNTTICVACPTCVGTVTKKSPAFFEDACYQQKNETRASVQNSAESTPAQDTVASAADADLEGESL